MTTKNYGYPLTLRLSQRLYLTVSGTTPGQPIVYIKGLFLIWIVVSDKVPVC